MDATSTLLQIAQDRSVMLSPFGIAIQIVVGAIIAQCLVAPLWGWTPMMLAVFEGTNQLVRILRNRSAKILSADVLPVLTPIQKFQVRIMSFLLSGLILISQFLLKRLRLRVPYPLEDVIEPCRDEDAREGREHI